MALHSSDLVNSDSLDERMELLTRTLRIHVGRVFLICIAEGWPFCGTADTPRRGGIFTGSVLIDNLRIAGV